MSAPDIHRHLRAYTATGMAIALVMVTGCGGDEAIINPGGTLPEIATTTTLGPSETTLAPFFETHKLTAGETMRVVAETYNVPLSVLLEYNKERLGDNPNNVPIGTEIIIPDHRWITTLPPVSTTQAPGG